MIRLPQWREFVLNNKLSDIKQKIISNEEYKNWTNIISNLEKEKKDYI